jgi:hypothetical protein
MPINQFYDSLQEYIAELKGIRDRFKKTSGGLWIADNDGPRLHTIVIEVSDLITDFLGQNKYSTMIGNYYNSGKANMYRSPSLNSVREIISVLTSLQTRAERNPELLVEKFLNPNTPAKQNIKYPDKLTLKWLWEHVPAKYYWSLLLAFFFVFSIGIVFGKTSLYKSLTETATAIVSSGTNTSKTEK